MSQHVRTYAPGTRVRIVSDEVAKPWWRQGDVGTVMETSTFNGAWTIWVAWDSDNPDRGPAPQVGYAFEQLEVVEE